ncbi:MAG: hypothetical protein ACRDSK_22910 [Actinophytocola sp.]|uniref:hypothetical protein n=1 Tax=Actinophytocola sp. TaxID=1872138 RepID=UPI003D6ACF8A
MSAPPYVLNYTAEAEKVIDDLQSPQYKTKLKKVRKTLRLLQNPGPSHPGLNSHRYQSVPGPGGAALWESYVENKTPSAWRIWWIYGDADEIIIVTIGPHP